MRASLVLLVALALSGCGTGYRTTLLETAEGDRRALVYRASIPNGYDVISVDYDAALVGLASGDSVSTSTSVEGKGVLSVYAIERATSERVVFIYDDIEVRRTPTAVIRLTGDG